jgi:hypothetical protein
LQLLKQAQSLLAWAWTASITSSVAQKAATALRGTAPFENVELKRIFCSAEGMREDDAW